MQPTVEHVIGHDHLIQATAELGHDDVLAFGSRYGGVDPGIGVEDCDLHADGSMALIWGGRGVAMNHNSHLDSDDSALEIRSGDMDTSTVSAARSPSRSDARPPPGAGRRHAWMEGEG